MKIRFGIHKSLKPLAFAALALSAQFVPGVARAQFLFVTNDGSITITGYSGAGGTVSIPSMIDDFPVTSIGNYAFSAFEGYAGSGGIAPPPPIRTPKVAVSQIITNVTIPGSVTNIGISAFMGCTNLVNLALSNGLVSIRDNAFFGCTALPRVTIPGSVTNIGIAPFGACTRLTNIVADVLNSNFTSAAGVLFDRPMTTLIEFPSGRTGSYAIPSGVTTVEILAFDDCPNLSGVTFPNTVVDISPQAFSQCSKLTTVTIPNSVIAIGFLAFNGCTNLNSVAIGSGVIYLDQTAFRQCPKLTSITVDTRDTNYTSSTGVLFNKKMTTLVAYPEGRTGSYTIPNTVTMTADGAFVNCTKLSSVNIPNGLTVIGSETFLGCNGLVNLMIPNSVTSIGFFAISECTGLATLTIGSGVTNIEAAGYGYGYGSRGGLFADCLKLTSITVDAHNACYRSTNGVLFDKAMTTLLQYPAGKTGRYVIPNGVINLMDGAFAGCAGLKNVTLPNSVTNLGNYTFANCASLTNINLGQGISSLEYDFYNCTNLVSVFFAGNAPTFFYYQPFGNNVTVYYLPGTSGWDSFSHYDGVSTVMFHAPNPNGSLRVFINPSGAVTAGAQWRVDGGLLQPAGATVLGLTVGSHTVSFTPITGWTSPSNQVVQVSSNSVASAAGFYTATGLFAFVCQTNPDNTLTIVQYAGPGGDVAVPGAINGRTVTAIGDGAFSGYPTLTSVTIPSSVASIGNWAFSGCDHLANVVMVNGLANIGGSAFQNCLALTNVTIPGSVTNIGDYGFANCTSLAKAKLLDGITNTGNYVFQYCSSLADVTLPAGLTAIGNGAFSVCTNLASMNIPGSVVSIGTYAFENCGLTNVTIPAGASIGDDAFFTCLSLTNATLLDGVVNIGADAFYRSSLSSITIPGSVTNIGDEAFDLCFNLTNATLLNGIVTMGNHVFDNCAGLTAVAIPASVAKMGPLDFSFCYSLTNIAVDVSNANYASADGVLYDKSLSQLLQYPAGKTRSYIVPGGVTGIGEEAFDGCYKLAGVIFPGSLTAIGRDAFNDCGNLDSVTIPSGVTSIGEDAFLYCWGMTNISVDIFNPDYASADSVLFDKTFTTLIRCPELKMGSYAIPGGVMSIAHDAFYDCSSLTAVVIPGSVTNIGDEAFGFCNSLTSATIPGSAIIIGTQAFFGCDSLTNVTMAFGIADVGNSAFSFCDSLASVTIPGSVTNIENGAFENCSALTGVIIPNSVASIGDYAFYSCSSLTNLVISDGITSLGDSVFESCSGLRTVTIPGSVTNLASYTFGSCAGLQSIYFEGNAPGPFGAWWPGMGPFSGDTGTVYYLPGTTGWTATFAGLPTEPWHQSAPLILNNGFDSSGQNKRFGFTIAWATNRPVIVDACTNLSHPVWLPVQTNALVNGTNYFSDARWTNHPSRFYRVRMQ